MPPARVEVVMSSVIAIVQPYELMSVAEQKYVLAEYARDAGVKIDQFIGEDGILTPESPSFNSLLESISTGNTSHVLLLDGVAPALPQTLLDECNAGGGKIHLVDSHKGLKLAG
jgi:hypothetical protein